MSTQNEQAGEFTLLVKTLSSVVGVVWARFTKKGIISLHFALIIPPQFINLARPSFDGMKLNDAN